MSGNINKTQFLWDDFRIERGKAIRKELKKSNDKVEVAFHKELADIFLFRLGRDPGFVWEVRRRIAKDPDISGLMEKYLLSLMFLDKNTINEKIFSITKNYERSIKFPSKTSYPTVVEKSYLDENSQRKTFNESEQRKKYLEERLESAVSLTDEDEIASIQFHAKIFDIIKLEGMRNSKEHVRIATESFYYGIPGLKEIHNNANRKILENITIASQYFENIKFADNLVVESVPYNSDFMLFAINLLDYIHDDQFSEYFDPFKREWVLIKTLTLIQEELWFDKLSEEEKIDLLNSFFNFEITDELLNEWKTWEQIPDSFYIFELADISKHLALAKYFEESKILYRFILNNTTNYWLKFICTDGMGLCERELNNFEQSLIHFEATFDLIKKGHHAGCKHSAKYYMADSLIAIGQLTYFLKSPEDAAQYFGKVKQLLSEFTEEETQKIFKNISYTYILKERYHQEKQFIQRCESSENPNKIRFDNIQRQMKIEKEKIADLIIPGIFTLHLKVDENEISYSLRAFIRAELAFNSFQYETAIRWYGISYSRSLFDPQALKRVLCYYNQRRYDEAIVELNRLSSLIQPPEFLIECYALLGSIAIQQNKIEEGIFYLKKCVQLNFIKSNRMKVKNPQKSLDLCLKYLVSLKNRDVLIRIFDRLADSIAEFSNSAIANNLIGLSFSEIYGSHEAIRYFDRALDQNPVRNVNGNILTNKGALLFDVGKYDEAIELLEESLNFVDDNPICYYNLASSYQNAGDFLNAEKYIRQAAILDPQNKKYSKFIVFNLSLKTDQINQPRDLNPEVREIWNLAEKKVLNLQNNPSLSQFIFREMVEGYCTGLELLLSKEISQKLWELFLKPYNCSSKKRGYLPFCLYKLIKSNGEFNITLGQWREFQNDLEQPEFQNNRIVQQVRSYLKSQFKGKFHIICENCSTLSTPRAKAVHPKNVSWDNVITGRGDIIQVLNLISGIIYEKKLSES